MTDEQTRDAIIKFIDEADQPVSNYTFISDLQTLYPELKRTELVKQVLWLHGRRKIIQDVEGYITLGPDMFTWCLENKDWIVRDYPNQYVAIDSWSRCVLVHDASEEAFMNKLQRLNEEGLESNELYTIHTFLLGGGGFVGAVPPEPAEEIDWKQLALGVLHQILQDEENCQECKLAEKLLMLYGGKELIRALHQLIDSGVLSIQCLDSIAKAAERLEHK